MATLPTVNGAVTLLDVANRIDPNGDVAAIAELLNQSNEVLLDMLWKESNLPTGHKSIVRVNLPTVIWRSAYQGVPASKSQTAPIIDTIGLLETRSSIDKDVADLNGNSAAYRLSESSAFCPPPVT